MSKHSLLLFAIALTLVGCPDPQERFDEFVDRTKEERQAGGGSGGPSGEIADVNGRFLLSMNTSLGPGRILEFDTLTEIDINQDGSCPAAGCTMRFEIQPVVPSDPFPGKPCADPGTPVGELIVLEDVPVAEDGSFVAAFGTREVGGCANPISGGDIVARLRLEGTIVNSTLYCGAVAGSVSEPVRGVLQNSTFAAIPIEGGVFPAPVFACPDGSGAGGTGGGEAGTGGGEAGTDGGAGAGGGEAGTGGEAGSGGGS